MPPFMTAAELAAFECDGFVTVQTGIPALLLAEAAAAMIAGSPPPDPEKKSYRTSMGTDSPEIVEVPAFRAILEHPSIVACAMEVLDTAAVEVFQVSPLVAFPQPPTDRGAASGHRFHSDTELAPADFAATPRRLTCEMFIWLVDVPAGRANLTVHAGSHTRNMAAWAAQDGAAEYPRIVGHREDELPPPPGGWAAAAPVAVEAVAGQVTVLTTAVTHSASDNLDNSPRVVLNPSFVAREFLMRLPANQAAKKVGRQPICHEHCHCAAAGGWAVLMHSVHAVNRVHALLALAMSPPECSDLEV